MAGYRGKELSYLKIGADNLENTKGDLSISISVDEIDVKDDSSDGYNEAIAGDQTITISGSFNYQLEADGSAAQQAIIEAGTSNGTLATVEYAFEDVAGSKKWTADGFVQIVALQMEIHKHLVLQ